MTQRDELQHKLTELTEAVKSAHHDPATFDWEARATDFEAKLAVLQAAQDRIPTRIASGGHPIYAEGVDKALRAGELKNNRYATAIRHIGATGVYRGFMGTEIKSIDLAMANAVMTKGSQFWPGTFVSPSNDLKAALKALSSTGTATGDELVPTDFAAELWEDVHMANVLVSNLEPIVMTSNPLDLPSALGDVTFRKGTENQAFTAGDPATAKHTLTVTELGAEVDWSYTLDEDAIVALMPAVRKTLARNAAEYMDGFALNADATVTATGNVNSDDGAPAADNYYISAGQDGIRHQWIVDNTSQALAGGGDAMSDADFTSTMALMGKYAADPRQLLCICDVYTYLRGFLNATTTSSPGTFLVDQSAVGFSIIVQGQIASYRGVPIVIPTLAPRSMADGKLSVTASSNTLGQFTLLNRSQWRSGFKREMLIEVDRDIQKRQIIMVISYRQAIGCRGTRSSNTHTAGTINLLVT